ncbi:hypothetical protein Tco_0189744 [Tanacetum coccineum]
MDANKKINFEHSLCPNENKILANILQNHPIRFSIVASSSVPWIYLRQFWHTLKEDGSKYRLKFMLDRKELTLTLDDFRTIFHLPQATNNNHDHFVHAPNSQRCHYMTAFPEISRRAHDKYHNLEDDEMVKSNFNSGKHKDGDGRSEHYYGRKHQARGRKSMKTWSVETEFPAIAFNNEISFEKTLSCEPTVSSLNDEIDFRILFDDSDDEDTEVFDKTSFSYKIISTNDLKTDSENDNEKNGFPAIVYNDAQASKSDLLTELILRPQHIDEFDLKNETSLSEHDEEEQKVLYFNDLFPFNIIHPDDLKSEKTMMIMRSIKYSLWEILDSRGAIPSKTTIDAKIAILEMGEYSQKWHNGISRSKSIETSNGLAAMQAQLNNLGREIKKVNEKVYVAQSNMAYGSSPRDQRYQYLRYEGLQYTDVDIVDFEGLSARMLMEHRDAQGVSLFTSRAWRQLFDIRGPLLHKLILEFFSTFRFGEVVTDLETVGALQFQLGGARSRLSWRQFILALGLHTDEEMKTVRFRISSVGDFLSTALSYTTIRDLILRLRHRLIACSITGRIQAPKKSGALISGGEFVARLAEHFGLLIEERLRGLTVIAPELPIIDMAELVRLQICIEIDDTWAWVAIRPERQPDITVGAPGVAQDAPTIDEGDQAILAPVQAPPPPPAASRTMP